MHLKWMHIFFLLYSFSYALLISLLIFNIKTYIHIEKYVRACPNDRTVKHNNLFDNNLFMSSGPWSFCVFFSSQLFSLLVRLLSYFWICIYPVFNDSHLSFYKTSSSNITYTLCWKILTPWLFTSGDNTK